MQDRYIGDVGDFGKFSLLRKLTDNNPPIDRLKLGVVWYKFPDEAHNGDGRHIGYLRDGSFSMLDPDLHSGLARIVTLGRRTIEEFERSGMLPDDTRYHATPVAGVAGDGPVPHRRAAYRSAWLAQALDNTASSDLVFLDPDNGIASQIAARDGPKAGKYVLLEEIAAFWARGQSLVVYPHLNRTASHKSQISAMAIRIADAIGRPAFLCPVVLKRGSCRVFWVIGHENHLASLNAGVRNFIEAGWHAHCDATPERFIPATHDGVDPEDGLGNVPFAAAAPLSFDG